MLCIGDLAEATKPSIERFMCNQCLGDHLRGRHAANRVTISSSTFFGMIRTSGILALLQCPGCREVVAKYNENKQYIHAKCDHSECAACARIPYDKIDCSLCVAAHHRTHR